MISLLLLALALASDAFAVAVCQGALAGPRPWRPSIAIGAAFGVAQAIAPLIGWSVGILFTGLLESVDHWIAFILLAFIGGKMLVEGIREDPPGEERVRATRWRLLGLAVATSIDAVAAGFALPTLGVGIALSVGIIGIVTFALSFGGVWAGRVASAALGSKAEVLGGVVLIGLGVKVLFDHHAFG
ncbi:MAG: hypothetical protein GC155_07020 [Alphaproteobacteria bacterium]|nr:hypothetical protein [Alphaproteobacteria bacterium]